MCPSLRVIARPRQTADDAGPLVAVQGGQLGDAERQLAPATAAGGEHQRVVRAAHRAQHHLVVAAADRCEHVVAVVREMAAALVQLGPRERGGVHMGVPGAPLQVDDVAGERIPYRAAFRQPQGQTGAD